MAYTSINFKTKKQLKQALAEGQRIDVYQPGPFPLSPHKGKYVGLEGPHYPAPHAWYAVGEIDPGTNELIKVLTPAEVKKAYR